MTCEKYPAGKFKKTHDLACEAMALGHTARTGSQHFVSKARLADIALIEAHQDSMSPEELARSTATIRAIVLGRRKYDECADYKLVRKKRQLEDKSAA